MVPTSTSSSPFAPAANILNRIWSTQKGLKSVVYSSQGELTCSKTTFAQCSHVLEHKSTLDRLLKEVPYLQAKNKGLLYVLLYELLIGPNKRIRGGGAIKRQLMAQENILKEKLKEINASSLRKPCFSDPPLKPTVIPRYVRINTLVADSSTTLQKLRQRIRPIYIDPDVPDLLVIDATPENRALLQEFVLSNEIVLQDKSSCFSALCLVHGYGGKKSSHCDFLDACAAPGNKTSHLAALVQSQNLGNCDNHNTEGTSVIYALDKSPQRCALLKRRMMGLVPDKSVQCYNVDFLETYGGAGINSKENKDAEVKQYARGTTLPENIRAILLDPSCSGSGMTSNHTEQYLDRDPYFMDERIRALSDFQFLALKHATCNFPLVDRVVYSTCSRYYQENEGVIKRILDFTTGEWQLVAPSCLKHWHRRGLFPKDGSDGLTFDQARCVIRVDPELDATNGFFVACLERTNFKDNESDKTSSTWKSHADTLPEGMELYHNQFDDSLKASAQSSDTSKLSNKRKSSDLEARSLDRNIGTHIKKRLKKVEWKRQQRLKKKERLKRKNA
ncbi:16S rRNA m5C 967 methyltransferase [Nitzschia inconspicua]|uniref:16S rRNA m5C 967 methyltransferase n=1 Tax=Nitzschia inconspicua TaxID=303405 RepID=A0A9K3PGH5_9STRA|nr:16S rRNA m5C 967 methyltransferase [Nitzschia inconspicua]